MTQAPLDKIYTAHEAAERLRLPNRGLIKIAKRIGACSVRGRTFLFSEADLLAIWEEMRKPPAEPRRLPVSPPPSNYKLHKSLVELSRKKKSVSQKARAIVLARSQKKFARKLRKEE